MISCGQRKRCQSSSEIKTLLSRGQAGPLRLKSWSPLSVTPSQLPHCSPNPHSSRFLPLRVLCSIPLKRGCYGHQPKHALGTTEITVLIYTFSLMKKRRDNDEISLGGCERGAQGRPTCHPPLKAPAYWCLMLHFPITHYPATFWFTKCNQLQNHSQMLGQWFIAVQIYLAKKILNDKTVPTDILPIIQFTFIAGNG